MAKTETKAEESSEEKAERKEGPLAIEFIDKDEATSTRVPNNVVGMVVTQRNGELTQRFDFDAFPETIKQGLIASGAKKLIETYARNGANENGSNIIELATHAYNNLMQGKMYSRAGNGEGTSSRASKFDFDFWGLVVKRYWKQAKKADPTETQLAAFRTRLESMTPKDRNKFIAVQKENPIFNAAYLAEKARKEAGKVQKGDDAPAVLDLF